MKEGYSTYNDGIEYWVYPDGRRERVTPISSGETINPAMQDTISRSPVPFYPEYPVAVAEPEPADPFTASLIPEFLSGPYQSDEPGFGSEFTPDPEDVPVPPTMKPPYPGQEFPGQFADPVPIPPTSPFFGTPQYPAWGQPGSGFYDPAQPEGGFNNPYFDPNYGKPNYARPWDYDAPDEGFTHPTDPFFAAPGAGNFPQFEITPPQGFPGGEPYTPPSTGGGGLSMDGDLITILALTGGLGGGRNGGGFSSLLRKSMLFTRGGYPLLAAQGRITVTDMLMIPMLSGGGGIFGGISNPGGGGGASSTTKWANFA